jgi:hypothetical protein
LTRAGVLILGAYVVVAVVTFGVVGHGILPLFDSIGPTPAYRWLRPPTLVAEGNRAPTVGERVVALGPDGSQPASISTGDGQVAVTLGPGTIPAHGRDSTVRVTVTPMDAAALTSPPPGLRADGNAYDVALTYEPSGAPVGPIVGGNIVLQVPEPASTVLFAATGAWQAHNGQRVGGPEFVGSSFEGSGHYLAAASGQPHGVGNAARHVSTLAFAALVAVLAVVVAAGPAVWRALRR